MKKLMIGLFVVSVLLSGTWGMANASEIELIDTTLFTATGTDPAEDLIGYGGEAVNKLEGIGDYVYWAHHFTLLPDLGEILEAELTLWFTDDEPDKMWNPLSWEFAFGYAESGDWDLGGVNTGEYEYDIDVTTSLLDGIFKVKVVSLAGDFYLDKSELSIEYAPVPEPASLLLLGCGLAGLALYCRRKSA